MDRPDRKLNRLENYDYSRNGLYFITICTKDRVPYLSKVTSVGNAVGDIPTILKNVGVGDGVLDVPEFKLTEYGRILNDQIIEINSVYKKLKIIKYVIMPDHLHMIIYLFDDDNVFGGTSRTPSPTNAVIPSLISTLKRFVNKKIGFNIWQRSYHDHIIRNEKEFLEICDYIDNNPTNWVNDIYNQNYWR
ncbi:transposase [Ruminococcus sp.]|uniref:transposase n=1 Tax=Ruminococcus sp. TaxID=41978 RepID=UPI0025EB2A5A|nr:transposase [Ruminococcus sp.]